MATLNDIITLANAGYTKADITALLGARQDPAPAPAPAPAPQPAPVPQQDSAPAPAQPDQPDAMTAVLQQLQGLTQAIQTSNIAGSSMGRSVTPEQQVDDIIASIIAPPTPNK